MPVSILFCEGGSGSPDVRVLRSILRGLPIQVKPQGPKYGLGAYIRAYRAAVGSVTIASIRDSDFDRDHVPPHGQTRAWRVEDDRIWLGWYWERAEIESYLLDPILVERVLDPDRLSLDAYRSALTAAATQLADYTAARAALARSRGRFQPLPNTWGVASGIRDHVLPIACTAAECRVEIERIVIEHQTRLQANDVVALFEPPIAPTW